MNDVSQVQVLAKWVEQIGEEMQLSMPAVFQLNLALEEAVVNVINYAYPNGKKSTFSLKADSDEDGNPETIAFILTDNGIPFDPTTSTAPDITLPAEDRNIGGLGIFLVKQIMQKVKYKRLNNQNILHMTYKVNRN